MENTNNENLKSIDGPWFRSPTFSKNEIRVLLNILEKFKSIILNKNVDSVSNYAKEAAWVKITKLYNEHNFKHVRTVDNLRVKWENLKRRAKKAFQNNTDNDFAEYDDIMIHVFKLMQGMDNRPDVMEPSYEAFRELDADESERNDDSEDEICQDDTLLDDSLNEKESERQARTSNFTPQESDLLIKCVKPERKIILSSKTNKRTNLLKYAAWLRVTKNFNEICPNKRSVDALKRKFINMKRMYTKCSKDENGVPSKKESHLEVGIEPIKSELFESKIDDSDVDEDEENITRNDQRASPLQSNDDSVDPLKLVMSTDSGFGSTGFTSPWNEFENKEVVKLKLELLNYQLETAKLKRRRLEEAMKADEEERKNKALETALRLRTARIEVTAAEMKLPVSHPALAYTEREILAQEYLRST